MRQIDLEGGPPPHFTLNQDRAATLFDNPLHRGKAQSRPLPLRLRCEERLEKMSLDLRRHSSAGVADRKHHVSAPSRLHIPAHGPVFKIDICRLDGDAASQGHGVSRIDDQIHDRLLDLTRIGDHAP